MDGGEGRRVRVYHQQDAVDKTITNRIMLRFRPIAPKPAAGDLNHETVQIENKNKLLNQRRSKRKYGRVRKSSEYKRKKKITSNDEKGYTDCANDNNKVTTLQLLPERSDSLEEQSRKSGSWLSFSANNLVHQDQEINIPDKTLPFSLRSRVMNSDQRPITIMPEKSVVVSWVTVENVTDTCMDVQRLGSTDVERIINLEADKCPGFISDSYQVVRWVNGAYKRMVTMRRGNEVPDLVVRLVMKDRLPYDHEYKAFTCRIRLKDAWQKEKMLPCDVWRMDGGDFAWRLDLEAALSLGR